MCLEDKLLDIENENIKNLIYTIRGKQVMLDSDVAMLYQCETRIINQAVKRNIERFPEEFCFQLSENEFHNLRSQFVISNIEVNNQLKDLRFQFETSNKETNDEQEKMRLQNGTSNDNEEKINNRRGGRRYLPYAFTEQGIAMLSALLKSDIAIKVSVNIMKAFIEMRKFISLNGQVFERLTNIEYKLLEHDKKFDEVFNQLQQEENVKQKIFFEGQIYDAYSLIVDIIRKAKQKILIIDNYIDDSILKMLIKKNKDVEVVILTSDKSNISKLDIQKFNKEYPILKIAKTNKFHDRFIVIDNKELYHVGASIKDLGKKCFGINKIEDKNIIKKIIEI